MPMTSRSQRSDKPGGKDRAEDVPHARDGVIEDVQARIGGDVRLVFRARSGVTTCPPLAMLMTALPGRDMPLPSACAG